jgi:hypothetical protein
LKSIHKIQQKYFEIQQIVLFYDNMHTLINSINFGFCRKLTDLGYKISDIIFTENNFQKISFSLVQGEIYHLIKDTEYSGLINFPCPFKINERIILMNCVSAKIDVVDQIENKANATCKIKFKNKITSEDFMYIASWQNITLAQKKHALYINSGHSERWLKNINQILFGINANKLTAKILTQHNKYTLQWQIH